VKPPISFRECVFDVLLVGHPSELGVTIGVLSAILGDREATLPERRPVKGFAAHFPVIPFFVESN
jgi:hypothetical protein